MCCVREPFTAKDLGMYTDNQNLFVVGTIEDADRPALWQIARGSPEKVVPQFRCAGMFEVNTWQP